MPFVFARNYAFRLNNFDNANPQTIGERLEALNRKNNGHTRPEDVVADAKNRRSPTHPLFEWDDAICGECFRIEQARELIEILRISDHPDDPNAPTRRAFLNINEGPKNRSYRSVEDVMQSRDLQLKVLKAAENELRLFESRFQELADICTLVRQVRERVIERRRQVEAAEAKREAMRS
jgi:hypothetical protein